MKRKFVALVLLGLMLGALFVPTAAHAQFAGALTVDCTLAFPSPGGNTNCSGSGFGATAAPAACVGCTVTVNASYSEPCPVPVGFPVLGLASGTISAGGETGEFDWVRVGVTAVIVPLTGDSAGVGILVPHAPVGDCSAPNPSQEITVVAVGAAGLPI